MDEQRTDFLNEEPVFLYVHNWGCTKNHQSMGILRVSYELLSGEFYLSLILIQPKTNFFQNYNEDFYNV